MLFGAAVFSELDGLKGVSERIIFGEGIKIGTQSFEANRIHLLREVEVDLVIDGQTE